MDAGTGFRNFVFAAGIAVSGVSGAQAATVAFDVGVATTTPKTWTEAGFLFTLVRIVDGNCVTNSTKCLAFNDKDSTTMTLVGGGTFSLTSIWFQLLGKGSVTTLTVASPSASKSFKTADFAHNTGFTANFGTFFTDVTSILFSSTAQKGSGNLRIDDIVATATPMAPVPLPAAAGLLVMALGGMGFVGRRRKTVSA